MAEYFADPPGGIEQEEWRSANLDATPGSSELTADL
jgi:hypothetical protein